jgi:hypothetical protein
METRQLQLFRIFLICNLIFQPSRLPAEQIPVRHMEGVMLGFLVVRSLDGQPVAYGVLKQIVKGEGGEQVMDDLQFRFKDGSFYEEITKFTQRGEFRLVSDQVIQKGPSFKQETESWIDATTGKITVRSVEKGKEKTTTKHLDLPPDVANGLIFTLVKNVDPSAPQTTVSMVAASTTPRIVKLNIFPQQEKTIKIGLIEQKAQHYLVKVKIEGVAGVIAPVIGKQPPDMHVWIAKSEAPTFIESEGPLSQDSPVWRMEVTAPDPDSSKTNVSMK